MRMRKKKNLIPRMELVKNFIERDPFSKKGQWKDYKPDCEAIYLELGCGKGSFTVKTAAANPEILFIAIEKVADCLLLAMEKADKLKLSNVIFICGDAANLNDMFNVSEIDRIYINFCDPWPSKRHAKRRLTYEGFLISYRNILSEKGEIHFKTDNKPLFDFSLTQFPRAGYILTEITNDLHSQEPDVIMTDYEERFSKEGAKINRCIAVKSAMPDKNSDELPEYGLIAYLPQDLEHIEYIPYGMADIIEQEILRLKAEERKKNRTAK